MSRSFSRWLAGGLALAMLGWLGSGYVSSFIDGTNQPQIKQGDFSSAVPEFSDELLADSQKKQIEAKGDKGQSKAVNKQKDVTKSQADALEKPKTLVKTITSIAQEKLQTITLKGVTEAVKILHMKLEIDGTVEKIYAKEGSFISEGEPILQLYIRDKEAWLERAKALVKQRKIEYNAAKSLTRRQLQSESKLAESYTALKQAQAELLQMQLDKTYTTIKAPFRGYLNRIYVEEGDIIKEKSTDIATLMQYNPFLVVGYVPEKWVNEVTLGSSATVNIVGDVEKERDGIIQYVSRIADETTRSFRVEIEVPNGDGMIADGVSAKVEIPIEKVKAHKVAQSVFTLSYAGILGIKIVDEKNIVHFRPVEIIHNDNDGAWVTGLPDVARVITVGQVFVKEGDSVRFNEEQEP